MIILVVAPNRLKPGGKLIEDCKKMDGKLDYDASRML
jgi:hypothetical protein